MGIRNPAKPGDIAALWVGGRWILTIVRQVDELGRVTVSENMRGVFFRIEDAAKRKVAPAERFGGMRASEGLVERYSDQSFANEVELDAETKTWDRVSEIGEETLEDLT